jgi:transposase
MLTIGGTTRVFLAVQPVDLRGSFDRLYGYVTEVLREDPRSGHWFCFVNKRFTRIKVLVFDGTGLWVLNKRSVSHCPLWGLWRLCCIHTTHSTVA